MNPIAENTDIEKQYGEKEFDWIQESLHSEEITSRF